MTNPLPSNHGDAKLCSTGCGSMMENLHIYLCPVLNPENKGDLNNIINGTLHKMKEALSQWRTNMKKIEYFDSMDSL